jgi:hypothetical protein
VSLAADAQGLQSRYRRTRAFRASRAFRRDRRNGRPEDRSRRSPRPHPADLHRRDTGRPRKRAADEGSGDAGARRAFETLRRQKAAEVLLAYEPVWAIGENGIPATADYADARQAEIIAVAARGARPPIPCLYGGSVNPQNCEELISSPNIDGLFIGRSAWNVEGYIDILEKCTAKL